MKHKLYVTIDLQDIEHFVHFRLERSSSLYAYVGSMFLIFDDIEDGFACACPFFSFGEEVRSEVADLLDCRHDGGVLILGGPRVQIMTRPSVSTP